MRAIVLGLLAASLAQAAGGAEPELRVGSKRFTESYILAEIAVQAARRAGAPAVHEPGLGNTAILVQALSTGAIDVYPEYTGTIAREILASPADLPLAALNERLRARGLEASVALGFADGYAIGVRGDYARSHGLERISDLARMPDIRLGLSHEFLGRRDGWPGLAGAYGLPQEPRGLDHGLAYEALAAGEIDAIDLYSTDAKIARYGIVVLRDDRAYFPRYDAVMLHRLAAPGEHPRAWAAIEGLAGRIDEAAMVRLNSRAELDHVGFPEVAAEFFGAYSAGARPGLLAALFAPDFTRLLAQHAALVFGSLVAAALVGIPLGIAAARLRWLEQPLLAVTGLIQTIPALALLAFLIPATGAIGVRPAMLALFLYGLLPIVRNTHAGLAGVPPGVVQAGVALGLRPVQVLASIELPLAMPVILAGLQVAAVINVGTATIAAFVGAGGFGERIAQGLALNDNTMLLAGALPAAALALVVHALFEGLERLLPGRQRARGDATRPTSRRV